MAPPFACRLTGANTVYEPRRGRAGTEMPDSPPMNRHSVPCVQNPRGQRHSGQSPGGRHAGRHLVRHGHSGQTRSGARPPARNRALTVGGLPAVLTVGGLIPVLTNGTSMGSAPSYQPSATCAPAGGSAMRHGLPSYGYATRGFRSYWRMSAGDQCTNYAAYVESTVYHVREPRFLLGNGGEWAATAAAHGVLVNHTPSVGAVAEWNGGTFGIGPAGHVAVVEAVGPHDSYIIISQQHIGGSATTTTGPGSRPTGPRRVADVAEPLHPLPHPAPGQPRLLQPATGKVSDALLADDGASRPHRPGLGFHGVVPLIGDWRGNGRDRLGYYNPRYGTFHLLRAGAARQQREGQVRRAAHDPAGRRLDRRGQGRHRLLQPADRHLLPARDPSATDPLQKFRFGPPHMIPLAGDWNGDRKDGVAYYNPRTGLFACATLCGTERPRRQFRFGPPHMIPLAGNWSGVGGTASATTTAGLAPSTCGTGPARAAPAR